MFLLPFHVSLLVSASAGGPGVDMTENFGGVQRVIQTQTRRFQAMIDNDLVTLDEVLAPDLVYVHTTGRVEDKAAFLASLETGRLKYLAVTPSDVDVRVYGNLAVVVGTSAMEVNARGNGLSFSIRFIEVYRAEEGGWRLVAWQSTPLP